MKAADQLMTVDAANPANPIRQQSGTSPPGNATKANLQYIQQLTARKNLRHGPG